MHPRLLAVALVLLVVQGCAGVTLPPYRPLARPNDYRVDYLPYPSGMRLVVHEDPRASWVDVDVSYRVGATDEPAGKEGLAHLVEHLTFRTRHGGAQAPQVWDRLVASGAEFNGGTSHDSTDYGFSAPVDEFSRLMDLEAQRLRDPLAGLTEEDFRVERDVVVAELLQRYETSPQGCQFAWARAELLPGHPYGRSVCGTPESVRSITLEDVRAFVKQHYTPGHVVLVVSGPLSSKDVKSEVARGFGGLTGLGAATSTPPVQRTPPPLPPEPKGMVTKSGPVDYPRLWMMWTVPGFYSGKAAQAHIAAAVLDSVIDQHLTWDKRVYSAKTHFMELDGVSLLMAAIELRKAEDAQAVAELVHEQLGSLLLGQEQGPSPADPKAVGELSRVRNQLLTGAYLDLESLSTATVARFLRATGQPDYVAGWEKQLHEGLAGHFGPSLYEYLQRGRVRMMLMVPQKAGAGGGTVERARFNAPPSAEDLGRWDVPLPPGSYDVRRVALPPGLDKAERFTLPNGLKVVALRRGGLPLVEVRLWADTGLRAPGEAAMPGIALYSSWYSARAIWRHAPAVGARVSTQVGEDFALLASSAGSGNLPHLLDDLRAWLVDSMVYGPIFAEVQQWQVRRLERDAMRADMRAWQALTARLYPGHAYGDWPTPRQVMSLTPSRVNTWLAQRLYPWNMTLVLVGDLPPDAELKRWVGGLIGSVWGGTPPARQQRPAQAPPAPLEARTVVLVDQPGMSQAVLQLGLRWPLLDEGQAATADTLTWFLQEKLRHELREKLGLAYCVQVGRDERPLANSLFIYTTVEARAAAGALERVLAELGSLEAVPLTPERVERARWQVARGHALRFRTAAQAASHLVDLEHLGRSPDHWERYPGHLAAVTPASIQALAKQRSPGREVVVITGDAALLKPQLTSAGFSVEVLAPEPPVPMAHAP